MEILAVFVIILGMLIPVASTGIAIGFSFITKVWATVVTILSGTVSIFIGVFLVVNSYGSVSQLAVFSEPQPYLNPYMLISGIVIILIGLASIGNSVARLVIARKGLTLKQNT